MQPNQRGKKRGGTVLKGNNYNWSRSDKIYTMAQYQNRLETQYLTLMSMYLDN